MRLSSKIAGVVLCLSLAGCVGAPGKKEDVLSLKQTSFSALPGWGADMQQQAVVPLQKSCKRISEKDPAADFGVGGFAGSVAAWQDICQSLLTTPPLTDEATRVFLETYFTPYEVHGAAGTQGLFTGYYEPLLHGSATKHGKFTVPLYSRPDDLITVNLGDFKPSLKGETIMGRVKGEKLIPYYKREEIDKGALDSQKKEIVWVDSAVDAFFLHIQGSGQVRMENGEVWRVGYATENGQPYVAIGKELLKRNALTADNVSMQSIRQWLEGHPAEAADVMNLNTSYIFFRSLKDQEGPIGAEGVALTPRRSMAVDRKKIPYGVPVWLDAEDPDGQPRIQRLMVAQDTGGAITGAVRGDFFWGAGDEAVHKAGLMKSKGYAWILLPKTVDVPAEKLVK